MEQVEVDVANGEPGLGARWAGFGEWRRRLTEELVALPDTLQTLRRGARNFEVVSQRLAESSEGLEQATKVYEATLADSARRSADVATALRAQIDAVAAAGSPERALGALKEMQRLVGSVQQMNPFWPSGSGPAPGPRGPGHTGDPPPATDEPTPPVR